MAPAIAMADGPRKDLLRKIAQRGPSAIVAEAISSELVAVCGRIAGGLLTRDDLDAALPAIIPAREIPLRGSSRRAAFIPWREAALAEKRTEAPLPASFVHVVAALDHRGLVAVACYERPGEGVEVETLGLVAPYTASPVLRGKTRVRPGSPVAAAAPLALVRTTTESAIDMALAIAGDPDAERILGEALDSWSEDADQLTPAYERQGTLIGVMRTKNAVSLLARRGS
jgi:gamma-glutamyltranspeptidase/glutathione hydrolase